MNDVIEINGSVVYVRGFSRGAIYNFNDGKVYSINAEACRILEGFIANGELQGEFLDCLQKNSLISDEFRARPFQCPVLNKELDFAWLELTEVCNLRCIHCYEGDAHRDNSKVRLSFEQWKDVIQQLREAGCKKIEFIGGEPTVYPYFEELLAFAANLGHSIEIFSNLQDFNDRLLRFAKENDITIHFSIYGSSAATHDLITRKNGSFKILMYWLKRLLENNVRVVPAITMMRQNQYDIDDTIALLKSMGIPAGRMSIDAVRATTKRSNLGLELTDSRKNMALRRKPNFRANKRLFQKASCANTCLFGKFSIHSDGLVCPCEFSRDIVYGNVRDQTIAQILSSEALIKFWYFDFSKIEQCKGCEYRFACKDCRMLLGENGMENKNPRCFYNPMSGVWEQADDPSAISNSKN